MKKTLLLVIDLGTSFIKTGIYDAEGSCIAIASEPVKDHRPGPGIFIQKGDELFASVLACMKSVCAMVGEQARDIEAIAFTGQMAGSIGVSKSWDDVTHWLCSLDGRSNGIAEQMIREHGDLFLKVAGTGSPVMCPKIKWFEKEYPEQSRTIAKYMMISGYVIGKLGEMDIEDAIIDRTYLEWTGLSDVARDAWSEEILGLFHVDRSILPRIVCSNDICAHLSEKYARMCGMKAGIPLVSGAGDKAAGCIGAGIVDRGDMIFEASSYGAVTACVDSYNPDFSSRRIECVPSAIPGEFLVIYFVAGSGITLDWFISKMAVYPGADGRASFAAMDEAAAAIPPGSDGVLALGHLGGSAMPLDGALRGGFLGFTWSHTKAHFYRALLESYAYEFACSIRRMKELYPHIAFSDVKIIGGGAKSAVFSQMNCDVAMMPYRRLDREDIALWGGAILAGNAIGVFPDIKKTAKEHVHVVKEFQPRQNVHQQYMKYMKVYLEFVVTMHDHYAKLLDLASDPGGQSAQQ
jgi:xylulokinase